MKAYPVIYSRTKHVDFLPDFIVKPADLEFNSVKNYINNVIDDLDTVPGVRYFAFPTEKYAIFGIACFSKRLAELVSSQVDTAAYIDYISDDKGRRVSCVIGYAVPATEIADVPIVSLTDYWNSYISLIKDQWSFESHTHTIISNPTTFTESDFTNNLPGFSPLGGKYVIKSQDADAKSVVSIFVRNILNGERSSYISDVNTPELFNELAFTHATITEDLERRIKATQNNSRSETEFLRNANSSTGDMTTDFGNLTSPLQNKPNSTMQPASKPSEQTKPNSVLSPFVTATVSAGIVVLVLIVLLIILL